MEAPAVSDLASIYEKSDASWETPSPETPASSTTEVVAAPAEPTPAPNAEVAKPADPSPEGAKPETAAVEPTPFEKWVAKYGDQNKAAEEAWALNTRASEMARELAELKAAKTEPVATNAPAEVKAPEVAPVQEAAPEQITQWVNDFTAQDQTCVSWVNEYRQNKARLDVLANPQSPESLTSAGAEVQTLRAWLKFPAVAQDEFQKQTYEGHLVLAEAKYERLQNEAQRLSLSNERLDSHFSQRANQYRAQIHEHYQSQKRASQEKQEFDTQVTRHATELEKAWTPAFDRTVKQYQVPEPEIEDFKHDLRTEAMAALESGIKVEDLDGFMGKSAKRLMDRLDRSHRTKSAEYAKLATQRAAQPSPVPSVVPQVQPSTGDSLDELYKRVDLSWKQARL